jgi:hypothetical protein
MALKLLQPGIQPLGQFDGYDTEVLTLKGGEDGYVNPSGVQKRVMVSKTLNSGDRPLMLADEGIAGYGTLFGTVVGGTVGQVSTGGTVLGPHTATGSGKVTCWDKPGLYAVSLDAVDTTASTGLVPTNPTITTGAKIWATSAGLLTPNTGAKFEDVVVGRFVDFETNGSLVQTPNKLVTAIGLQSYAFAVFFFNPPIA